MLAVESKMFSDLTSVMCEPYNLDNVNLSYPSTMRLDDFQTLVGGKFSGYYGSYYPEQQCEPHRMDFDPGAGTYQELQSPKSYFLDDWRTKYVAEWTADDTVAWVIDTANNPAAPIHAADIPLTKFADLHGPALKDLTREDICALMHFPGVSREVSRRNGDILHSALEMLRDEQALRARERASAPLTVLRNLPTTHSYVCGEQLSLLDLDSRQQQLEAPGAYELPGCVPYALESGDEERWRTHDSASPECSYGSDHSKSGDERDERGKRPKRAPGRPKGSGRKPHKRIKSVSVPDFLRDLLHDPLYCPSIIRWENYSIGQFRFVKPDEVAKLWGQKKQNDKMSFEKFSRAMRYHYRGGVLVSVPSARLVYQFGPKGPNYQTDYPNFEMLRNEMSSAGRTSCD